MKFHLPALCKKFNRWL